MTRSFTKIHRLSDVVLLQALESRPDATPYVSYTFAGSGRQYDGVPLIISGTWALKEAAKLAKLKVLVEVAADPFPDGTDPTYLLPYVDDLKRLHEMMAGPVPPVQAIIYGCERGAATDLRQKYPDLTLFVSSVGAPHSMSEVGWDADVIVLPGESDNLERFTGIAVGYVEVVAAVPGPKATCFDCCNPGDIVKSFALGARFVEINSSMQGYAVEEVIASIHSACIALGAANPHQICGTATIAIR